MRSGAEPMLASPRLAEAVLSVVAPPDRAAAAVGDLLELMPGRGRLWFWKSVLGTALATSWRHFRAAPLMLTLNAAVACVGYMLVVFLLMMAIAPALAVLWLCGEVLANHTGFERLAESLALSGGWAAAGAAEESFSSWSCSWQRPTWREAGWRMSGRSERSRSR